MPLFVRCDRDHNTSLYHSSNRSRCQKYVSIHQSFSSTERIPLLNRTKEKSAHLLLQTPEDQLICSHNRVERTGDEERTRTRTTSVSSSFVKTARNMRKSSRCSETDALRRCASMARRDWRISEGKCGKRSLFQPLRNRIC